MQGIWVEIQKMWEIRVAMQRIKMEKSQNNGKRAHL